MIGSKIRNAIINHKWSFKALMNMDDAIRVLINDMNISSDDMVSYLGVEWEEKIKDAFQSLVIPEMKTYLIDILDDASVNLPKQINPKVPAPLPETDKISQLKDEIRNNTKQV